MGTTRSTRRPSRFFASSSPQQRKQRKESIGTTRADPARRRSAPHRGATTRPRHSFARSSRDSRRSRTSTPRRLASVLFVSRRDAAHDGARRRSPIRSCRRHTTCTRACCRFSSAHGARDDARESRRARGARGRRCEGGSARRQRARDVEGHAATGRCALGRAGARRCAACCAIIINLRPRWRDSSRCSTRCASRPHPNLYTYRRTEVVLADVFDRWGQPDSAAAHRALARPGAPLTVTTLAQK